MSTRLQQPLVARLHGVGDLQAHDVPLDVADVHLGPDLGEPAVVRPEVDGDAGRLGERDDGGLLDGAPVGTAP